jgi:hypothetical protein
VEKEALWIGVEIFVDIYKNAGYDHQLISRTIIDL